MSRLDYVVVVLATLVLLASGCLASLRRARGTTTQFILAGRRLPWWLGGSAMVAGATNADSPLHQSGKIRRDGLPGAWYYWSQAFAQAWHGLVFSRLWRRVQVSTVVEFYDVRYAGRAAVCGRVWSMFFASFIEGTLTLALGLLAMIKICVVMLGLQKPVLVLGHPVAPEVAIVIAGVALGISYATVSGLMGVVAGDIVEFFLTFGAAYALMFVVYRQVGYSAGLREGLSRLGRNGALAFTPAGGLAFLTYFILQPASMLAGNNWLNQRFLAMRDERQAMLSGIWRILNHFFIRCWPWYVCGLASLILLPGLSDETAYPTLIMRFLPSGMRGLMFSGFLVAFMSSVGASMHNAGSYFVNDCYRAFLVRNASERHYVWVIRATMLVMTLIATTIALASDQILRLLQFLLVMTSASGLVMLLRWFWWRINGWADFTAQLLCLPVTCFFMLGAGRGWVAAVLRVLGKSSADDRFGVSFIFTLSFTTAAWLVVMGLTPPEPLGKLESFFARVRPYGWWSPIARRLPHCVVTDDPWQDLRRYGLGLVLSMGLLFGMGLCLLGEPVYGAALLTLGALCGWRLVKAIDGGGDSLALSLVPPAAPPPAAPAALPAGDSS